MLQKLRGNSEQGFTLIELMIVIAIIGILAAIAIPNFISYRDKAYCSYAETDAGSLAAALADYFSNPDNTTLGGIVDTSRNTWNTDTSLNLGSLSGDNTATVSGSVNAIVITVSEATGRCPRTTGNWGLNVFTKTMAQ